MTYTLLALGFKRLRKNAYENTDDVLTWKLQKTRNQGVFGKLGQGSLDFWENLNRCTVNFWEIPSKITSSICIKLHFAPKNGSWIFMMFLWCWSLFQAISRGPKKGSAKKVRIYMDPWYHYNIEGITQTPYTPHSQVVFVDSTRCLLAEILLVTRAPKWLFSFNASTVSGFSRAPGGEKKHEMPVLVLYVIEYMYTCYINILNNIHRIHKNIFYKKIHI